MSGIRWDSSGRLIITPEARERMRVENERMRLARERRSRGPIHPRLPLVIDDGGREAAGFGSERADCVVRAIAIAACLPYAEVHAACWAFQNTWKRRRPGIAHGVSTDTPAFRWYMRHLGFAEPVDCRTNGRAGRVRLRPGDLPMGMIVATTQKHAVAVISGVIHDLEAPLETAIRHYWLKGL